MLGATGSVDLQAGNLEGIRQQISYYRELGLTYLHLMPLFARPEGENDGGYAVSSYRDVDPPLGTMEELAQLAQELREAGISLVVDFIFNHTANNHAWACKAMSGDLEFQGYYWMFDRKKKQLRGNSTYGQSFLIEVGASRGVKTHRSGSGPHSSSFSGT